MKPGALPPIRFPQSPSHEQWAAMSEREREQFMASIPQDPPPVEVHPPEGQAHTIPTREALEALEQYFKRRGRKIFLASNLNVLYPNEAPFAPDLMAVLDVEVSRDLELSAWVVAAQGRGLDLALEVHVSGDRNKDAVVNVERYARLGIPEYFFFDRPQRRLLGYRLASADKRSYVPILPQHGRIRSEVLDLDVGLLEGRLRFFAGSAELPHAAELIARLDELVAKLEGQVSEESRRLEEEQRLREEEQRLREEEQGRREEEQRLRVEEQRRREEAERRVAELTEELERLKRR